MGQSSLGGKLLAGLKKICNGATIRTWREIQILLYAGFFVEEEHHLIYYMRQPRS